MRAHGRPATPKEARDLAIESPTSAGLELARRWLALPPIAACGECQRFFRIIEDAPMAPGAGGYYEQRDKLKLVYALEAHGEPTGHGEIGLFPKHIIAAPERVLERAAAAHWPKEALAALGLALVMHEDAAKGRAG